jgi:hypothetical protein
MTAKENYGILRYIIPQYDEISLFAMSFTCSLLIIAAALETRWDIRNPFSTMEDVKIMAIIVMFISGLILSIYHAFSDRPKTSLEKYLMLFFAVILNGFSGIMAGTYFLEGAKGWMVIFPILNIINGAILLGMFRSQILDDRNISDHNVSIIQIALAATVIILLFAVCHYIFHLLWAQTLSICVLYATNLSRLTEVLFLRTPLRN